MSCKHELKDYVGFSDTFKYCIHCGKKASELPAVVAKDSIEEAIDNAYKQWVKNNMDTMTNGFWGVPLAGSFPLPSSTPPSSNNPVDPPTTTAGSTGWIKID